MNLGIKETFALQLLDQPSGRFRHGTLFSISPALAGAVLMELAAKGKIDLESPAVSVLDSTPACDDILDQTLELLAGAKKTRRVGYWVRRLSRSAKLIWRDALRQLCERGILERRETSLLGLIPVQRYHVKDCQTARMIRERLIEAAHNPSPPAGRDFSVVILLESSGHLRRLLPKKDLKDARKRIRLSSRSNLTARAVTAEARRTNAGLGVTSQAAQSCSQSAEAAPQPDRPFSRCEPRQPPGCKKARLPACGTRFRRAPTAAGAVRAGLMGLGLVSLFCRQSVQ